MRWPRLFAEIAIIFLLFHGSATALGSDRGQAGIVIAAIVVAATLVVERMRSGRTLTSAWRAVGLGMPHPTGIVVAAAVCLLLVLVVPVFARVTETAAAPAAGWLGLVPGLFAQGGIAEETLFRGYLFGRLRPGRSFWRAAGLSMFPFAAVHLLLFATMPWPIALAALLLSTVLSLPLARLYELGGSTIWPPALLHFVAQGTVKLVVIEGDAAPVFPLVWMAACVVLPLVVFLVPDRAD